MDRSDPHARGRPGSLPTVALRTDWIARSAATKHAAADGGCHHADSHRPGELGAPRAAAARIGIELVGTRLCGGGTRVWRARIQNLPEARAAGDFGAAGGANPGALSPLRAGGSDALLFRTGGGRARSELGRADSRTETSLFAARTMVASAAGLSDGSALSELCACGSEIPGLMISNAPGFQSETVRADCAGLPRDARLWRGTGHPRRNPPCGVAGGTEDVQPRYRDRCTLARRAAADPRRPDRHRPVDAEDGPGTRGNLVAVIGWDPLHPQVAARCAILRRHAVHRGRCGLLLVAVPGREGPLAAARPVDDRRAADSMRP